MGSELWFNYVPYQPDITQAFKKLLQAEFKAGNYLISSDRKPRSIRELRKLASSSGTGSILDFQAVGTTFYKLSTERKRKADREYFLKVSPLAPANLRMIYGTEKPTHADIEAHFEIFDTIPRGEGVYLIFYEEGAPVGIFFAGYSVD